MYRIVLATVLICFALATSNARAASPSDVIQEAVELLAEGLEGRKEELAADKDALYAFIDSILMPRFDRRFAAGAVL
ncbi:MAG: hypothetical protein OEM51_10815, partial [Gammaproteobacteria bacterium]|nr:hypothetical protein [Gammaproteobacteria bacterium]